MEEPLLTAPAGRDGVRRLSGASVNDEEADEEQHNEQSVSSAAAALILPASTHAAAPPELLSCDTSALISSRGGEGGERGGGERCARAAWYCGVALAVGCLPALAVIAVATGRTRADPLVQEDAAVLGILMLVLGLVFNVEDAAARSANRYVRRVFDVLPPILFCYFVPGMLSTLHVFSTDTDLPNPTRRRYEACRCQAGAACEAQGGDGFCASGALAASPPGDGFEGWPRCAGEEGCWIVEAYQGSQVPDVAQDVLLPSCLVLLTLSIDLPGVMKLGPQAVGLFLVGSASIMLGGPLVVLIFRLVWPEAVRGDLVWRALSCVAGDWIGGGANMLAMREIFNPCQERAGINPCDEDANLEVEYANLFGQVLTIDIFVSNLWLATLVFIAKSRLQRMDSWLGGDSSFIDEMRAKLSAIAAKSQRIASFTDFASMGGLGFGTMGAATLIALYLAPFLQRVAPALEQVSMTNKFFWLVVISTAAGLLFSFTRLRSLEGAGAARLGTVLLYVLICSIGMQMNIEAAFANPQMALLVVVWMLWHVVIMIAVSKLVRVPFFFMSVGSMANIGGAITAPIVATAFDPALAVVGVLLGVLGYALGTFLGYTSGLLMSFAAPGTTL